MTGNLLTSNSEDTKSFYKRSAVSLYQRLKCVIMCCLDIRKHHHPNWTSITLYENVQTSPRGAVCEDINVQTLNTLPCILCVWLSVWVVPVICLENSQSVKGGSCRLLFSTSLYISAHWHFLPFLYQENISITKEWVWDTQLHVRGQLHSFSTITSRSDLLLMSDDR